MLPMRLTAKNNLVRRGAYVGPGAGAPSHQHGIGKAALLRSHVENVFRHIPDVAAACHKSIVSADSTAGHVLLNGVVAPLHQHGFNVAALRDSLSELDT